jgi:hypothetical protein
MTHHLWLIVLVYGVVVAARYLIVWTAECRMRRLGGGNPPIKGILDALCEYAARDEEDAYRHRYRVTLFKNHGDKWLKIYARSGNITLGSRTCFRIDPNNEPSNEGVAGVCWFRDQVISVSELPELTDEPTEAEVQDYAQRTFYDVKKIMARLHRERPIHTRSLLGVQLMIHGKPWGALVFDSANPRAVTKKTYDAGVRRLVTALVYAIQETERAMD